MNATCKPKFDTLDALEAELHEMGSHSQEYWDKQVHTVPASRTLEREKFVVQQCTGKIVLHVGCTGPLDEAMRKAAKRCYGIDRQPSARPDYVAIDLDAYHEYNTLPACDGEPPELIVCGEVLEHLSNPGHFLVAMQRAYPTQPVIFTVPNAFSLGGQEWLVKRGRENVNKDHVCYYSFTTLKELLRRAGYAISEHYWYGGRPYVSEGLIIVARPRAETSARE